MEPTLNEDLIRSLTTAQSIQRGLSIMVAPWPGRQGRQRATIIVQEQFPKLIAREITCLGVSCCLQNVSPTAQQSRE